MRITIDKTFDTILLYISKSDYVELCATIFSL